MHTKWLRGSEDPMSQGPELTQEPFGFGRPWKEGEGVDRSVWGRMTITFPMVKDNFCGKKGQSENRKV